MLFSEKFTVSSRKVGFFSYYPTGLIPYVLFAVLLFLGAENKDRLLKNLASRIFNYDNVFHISLYHLFSSYGFLQFKDIISVFLQEYTIGKG